MSLFTKFTFLLKSEPIKNKASKLKSVWFIDESKCLSMREVLKLRRYSNQERIYGLRNKKFSSIRRWFMIELGLHSGLRVNEMAALQHFNLFIDQNKSSILVLGKGKKKRPVWVSSQFRQICRIYISYKKKFGYETYDDSYLLNNLKGTKISKRALQKDFKIISKKSKLPSYYHIHNLRHTYTTFLLKASNYNYRFVQIQLGHASIKTTQVYAGVLESEGKKALEKLYKQ